MFHVPNEFRFREKGHPLASEESDGNYGAFIIDHAGIEFVVIASEGLGWEHVSITPRRNRPPTWDQMCFFKGLFWDEEDCVVQYHPPKSEYVNNHPNCLHLWRPIDIEVTRPSYQLVGTK
jgi:hypothetical protein